MTADPVADLASVLDPAFADFDATDILDTTAVRAATGWVPDVPALPTAPKPRLLEVVADMAAARNLDEQAADHRSLAAWARTTKKEIAAAKRRRAKTVAALRAQYAECRADTAAVTAAVTSLAGRG